MNNWKLKMEDVISYEKPEGYSSRYSYIPHKELIEEIQEQIYKKGYTISEERYLSAMDNKIICGNYIISNGNDEIRPTISFVNSVNRIRSAEVYGHGMVLVCKNGMVNSLGKYKRKHLGDTSFDDVKYNINLVINSIEEEFEKITIQKEELKQIEIDKNIIAQLVGDMYVNNALITSTQLSILKEEINFSKNFKEMTAWSFYNWTTESYKNNHPSNYDKQHNKFHTYMLDQFDIKGKTNIFKKIII